MPPDSLEAERYAMNKSEVYKGHTIAQNPLTSTWFLFLKQGPPFTGTLGECKRAVDLLYTRGQQSLIVDPQR